MDYNIQNINILNFLGEYGVHIFISLTLFAGTLIYYFSIKSANPIYDSPKLSKKKPKKEKQLRNKFTKNVPAKVSQIKEPEKVDVKLSKEIIEVGKEPTDDEGTTWLPVVKVKPKKNTKPIKNPIVPSATSECRKKVECASVQTNLPITSIKEKPKSSVKYESKSTVIEHICDKIELPEIIETVQIVKDKIENEHKSICPIEDDKNTVEDIRNVSDSPTNSLSDDFELIDSYKTSSEDGLKLENEPVIEQVQDIPEISSTSGASRKKTKKQQKMISKQLIEAAATIEEEDQIKPIPIVNELKLNPSVNSVVSKKKRPRKEY